MKNVFWLIFKQANLLVGDFWKVWKGRTSNKSCLIRESWQPRVISNFDFQCFKFTFFKPFSMTNGDMGTWYHGCVIRDAFDVDIEDDEDMDDNDVASDDGSLVP